ncbi:MAG: DUF4230 domain-containing protein [Lachnospiraceae bacterium]|nr:DUF4230 domain-containing protein [Lachnospiraceae bacterium]
MSTHENKSKALFIIIPIAVTLALLAAMGVMFAILLNRIDNTSTTIVEKEEGLITEEEVRVSTTIRSGIEELGQLITASYWYEHAEYYEDSKKIKDFTIPFTTSSFILECTGSVKAGVDFSKVKVEETEDTITIILPEPEVLSNDIDADSFEVRDEKNSVFNKISVEDTTDTFKRIEEDELAKALDRGILKEARENAEKAIKSFAKNLISGKEYKITVKFE